MNKELILEDASEVVKEIIDKEEISQQQLADMMGTTRQSISQSLTRNSHGMRVDSFKKMVQALGYEVIIRKKYENTK